MIITTNIDNKNIVREIIDDNGSRIFLINDKELLLSNIKNNNITLGWNFDKNYIITYLKENEIVKLDKVYNRKNNKFINISNDDIKRKIEFMLLYKRCFDFESLFSVINNDLEYIDHRKREIITDYLTSGNYDIRYEDVISYILYCYPEFKQYMPYRNKYTIKDFIKLRNQNKDKIYKLHSISQDVNLIKNNIEDFNKELIDELEPQYKVLRMKK